jgi:hypothetical protein
VLEAEADEVDLAHQLVAEGEPEVGVRHLRKRRELGFAAGAHDGVDAAAPPYIARMDSRSVMPPLTAVA